jgi:hypothetical protein
VQMWEESTHLNSIHAKEFRQKVLYMWDLCGKIFFFFCNFISQPRILFDLGICFFCNFSRNPVCYLTWVFGFLAIFLATQHFFFLSWDIDSLQFSSQPSVLFDLGIDFLAIFLATQHFFFLSWDIDSLQFSSF